MKDDRLGRIEDKIDQLVDRIGSIDSTLSAQHVTLMDHTRRSLANEKAVEVIKDELKPILTHIAIVNLLGKLALLFLSSNIVWYGVKKIYELK